MRWGKAVKVGLGFCAGGIAAGALGLYMVTGWYGFSVVWLRGGSVWAEARADDARFSPGMRLALSGNVPDAVAQAPAWTKIAPGFETAEMPVLAAGREVDRVLLTRFDPARWRFETHTIRRATVDQGTGSRRPARAS
jgi:hypothetical protein